MIFSNKLAFILETTLFVYRLDGVFLPGRPIQAIVCWLVQGLPKFSTLG